MIRSIYNKRNSKKLEQNRILTLEEISKHNNKESLWMIIHGKVYDITSFIDKHPGGADVLFESAGGDGSDPFDEVGHSQDSIEMLEPLLIGIADDGKQKFLGNTWSRDRSIRRNKVTNPSLGESVFLRNLKNKKKRKQLIDKYFGVLLLVISMMALTCYVLLQKRKWSD